MVRVVDASYILSFLIPDEFTDRLEYEKLFSGNSELVAPDLLRFEVTNALLLAIKRKRLSRESALEVVDLFDSSPIGYWKVNIQGVFLLAEKLGLTAYDASYVWLARELKIKLLTKDKQILKVI